MSQAVPIGPITYSPGKCTRIMGGPLEAPTAFCLKDAVLHVFWDEDLENGFTCAEHSAELEKWKPYLTHPSEVPPCGLTGANVAMVVFENGSIDSWCYFEEGEREKQAEIREAINA